MDMEHIKVGLFEPAIEALPDKRPSLASPVVGSYSNNLYAVFDASIRSWACNGHIKTHGGKGNTFFIEDTDIISGMNGGNVDYSHICPPLEVVTNFLLWKQITG